MRTNYSIKNSITAFIENIISIICLFVGQTFFIKILGVEYIGLNGMFSSILTILNLFELGIGTTISYNLYRQIKEDNKESIKSLMKFYKKAYTYISLAIFLIGLLFTPILKYIVNDITIDINIYIIYILFLLTTVSTYFLSYKRNLIYSNQKSYIINIANIIYIIVLSILQILLLYLTRNYYLYLIIKIVCIIIENIALSIKTNIDYPYIKEKNIKPLDKNIKNNIVKKVKALFVHKTCRSIKDGTDNVIISMFLGIKTVGIYTCYYYIINTIKTLFSSIINSTTASVGNLLTEDNQQVNYLIFKRVRFLNYWIAVFTSVCLLLLIRPFIIIWVGRNYILGEFIILCLIINYFQNIMRCSYTVFKDSGGIWIEDVHVPIIQITLNIIFSIILLKLIGLAGVFIGTIIGSLPVWFYSYPKFIYKGLLNKPIKNYVKEISVHISIFLFILVICYLINLFSKNIFISLVISLIVPNLALFLIYRNTEEFKYYISLISSIFKKRKEHKL